MADNLQLSDAEQEVIINLEAARDALEIKTQEPDIPDQQERDDNAAGNPKKLLEETLIADAARDTEIDISPDATKTEIEAQKTDIAVEEMGKKIEYVEDGKLGEQAAIQAITEGRDTAAKLGSDEAIEIALAVSEVMAERAQEENVAPEELVIVAKSQAAEQQLAKGNER